MRSYIAYIRTALRLAARERVVVFFNYLFPLVFLLGLGELMGPVAVFALVLTLNILGTGFFGAGIRAAADREAGILRRFKVAPITPGPILVSSIVVGWIVFLPALAMFFGILYFRNHMPMPHNPVSLFIFLSIGVVAFRAMGMIIASVVNSMQESQILVQLLYLPMLMLSGATIPLTIMPDWLQVTAQFIPSTYLTLGMQGILLRGESLVQNWQAVVALIVTAAVSLFVCAKLFRWEKEEKLKPAAKLWVLAALAPFLVVGAWQVRDRGNIRKVQILAHEANRNAVWLVRDARIFTGERVIERGSLLLKGGRIVQIFEGEAPKAKDLGAEEIVASGKTVLPGLIDAETVLALDAGLPPGSAKDALAIAERALSAYLYSGVTGVGSAGLPANVQGMITKRYESGEKLGAAVLRSYDFAATQPCRFTLLTLSDAAAERESGRLDVLKDSLVQQVAPHSLLTRLEAAYRTPEPRNAQMPRLDAAMRSLVTAQAGGTKLAAATLSGTPLLVHGPMVHREMQLLVQAGLKPIEALKAATINAATCLGAGDRAGSLKVGGPATLIVVDGNPLEEIASTEHVTTVFFNGELVRRGELIAQK